MLLVVASPLARPPAGTPSPKKYVAPDTFICSQGLDFNNDTDYYAKIDRTGINSYNSSLGQYDVAG